LYTKELIGANLPVEKNGKRPSEPISLPPTEAKRKKLEGKNNTMSSSGARRSSSRLNGTAAESKAGSGTTSSSSAVSGAHNAIGVPRVGVGVVVLNKEDNILIGKRKSPHGQGMRIQKDQADDEGTWSLPGVRNPVLPRGLISGSLGIFRIVWPVRTTRSSRRSEFGVGGRPQVRIC